MKYIDLHCDTALRIYDARADLYSNPFHVSLEKAASLDKYVQLAAIFTPPSLSDDEGWKKLLSVREYLLNECERHGVALLRSRDDLRRFWESDQKFAIILTAEDARVLDGKIERVREMYDLGFRVLTMLWGGDTSIGGSHDTNNGLTQFGEEAVREIIRLGIIPDVSHASRASTERIFELCEEHGSSPIATHSNYYGVREHSRNLTREEFCRLTSLGGIAGLSLCVTHLSAEEPVSSDSVIEHARAYSDIRTDRTALGCDLDGTDLPSDISGVADIPYLHEKMSQAGFSQDVLDSIFYKTALEFLLKNLPGD